MYSIPKAAVEVFEKHNTASAAVSAGVLTRAGRPCGLRTAERWYHFWKSGPDSYEIGWDGSPQGAGLPKEEPPSASETADGMSASSVTETIKSPEDLIAACGIDMTVWEALKSEVKTFQQGRRDEFKDLDFNDGKITGYVSDEGKLTVKTLYSVKVWFARRPEKPMTDVLRSLVSDITSLSPKFTALPHRVSTHNNLFVPIFTDPHFNRRALSRDWTLDIASAEFLQTVDVMIRRVGGLNTNIDKVCFVLGNDAGNSDDHRGSQTTKGTPQQDSARQVEMIDVVIRTFVAAALRFRELAPVDIIMIGGNHDRLITYMLGKVLEAYFHNTADITVNAAPEPRKYYSYGRTLLGFEHGDVVKAKDLAMIMADECADLWHSNQHRLFYRGHFHRQSEVYHAVEDIQGVVVKTFPAFCPQNEWEQYMGYVGNKRAATGVLIHHENGPAAEFQVFIDELENT